MYRTDGDHHAVIRFPLCMFFMFGAPNDEALGGHPLAQVGLRHYSVHEVRESALAYELERRNAVHPRHDPASFANRRHYVFTFQDSTLECVVPGDKWWAPTVTVYVNVEEAEGAWRATRPVEQSAADTTIKEP
jgi:hypothetical protein